MKKITKFFSALLALLAVGLITVSLVACSSGDDSDSGSGNGGGSNVDYVAKYEWEPTDGRTGMHDYFIFYKNGNFEYIEEQTIGSYTDKDTEAKGTYTLEEGNWENGKVKLNATEGDKASNYKGTFTIKDKVLTVDYKDFTATYTSKVQADSGKDNSDTNKDKDSGKDTPSDSKTTGSATFSGTAWGENVTAEFYENGTYVQYRNGTPDGKGTYKFKNGDFANGTLTCTESYEYKNGGWVSLLDDDIFDCTITNGVLSNKYTTMWGFTMTKVDSNSSESEKTETTTEKSYTVTVTSPSNGTVSADKTSAKKGETVTITASANSGFELLSLTLKDAYENKIEAKADSSKTKYTFTMPDSFVLVNASFGKPYHAKYVWDPSKDPSDGRTGLYDYFVFYTDNTYEYIETVTLGSYSEKETDSAGTYTIDSGDWDNGTITLNATSGKKLNSYTGKCTITNGVFVCDDFTWSNKFTKE